MSKMSGARAFAEMMCHSGVSHILFVPVCMAKALAEMEDLPIRRVLVHGEKAAAYMADGYARASGKPGVCMAQANGASNLAAWLRDGYMAGSPIITITGGPTPEGGYRHAYQGVEDFTQFVPVTKFNACVDAVTRMPDLLRQSLREATSSPDNRGELDEMVSVVPNSSFIPATRRYLVFSKVTVENQSESQQGSVFITIDDGPVRKRFDGTR